MNLQDHIDQLTATARTLRAAQRRPEDDVALQEALQATRALLELEKELEGQLVAQVRQEARWPWQRVAGALGISHQATMRKYAEL